MKINKVIIALLVLIAGSSCKKFLEPQPDNFKDINTIMKFREDFLGVLYSTYYNIPSRISFDYEAATDNAVTNNPNSVPAQAAAGGLYTQNNPFGDSWTNDYNAINKINWFLERMVLDESKPIPTPVRFDVDPVLNMQAFRFALGEGYFLRAWFEFDLLKKYGGVGTDGKVYGFPIVTNSLQIGDNLIFPRNTYQECVDRIVADCDSATKYLPLTFKNPTGGRPNGLVTDAGHASGIASMALKARTLLYAASPAYNITNNVALWDKAAKAASDAIKASDLGLSDLLSFSAYYGKGTVNDNKYDNRDMFFRGRIRSGETIYETENLPPRANSGGGLINPTQNLVDAFPMSDGWPRGTSPVKLIDPAKVEVNRDPRLDLFIYRHGETIKDMPSNNPETPQIQGTLETFAGGLDAAGRDVKATRTGYYLQKLLDNAASLKSSARVTTTIAPILLGKPELYLNFAEAAIRVTGNPTTKIYDFSAKEVIEKVRKRAFGSADTYLNTLNTNSALFLQMVLNERRVELCFEDHRFWDLRRLSTGVSDLNALKTSAFGIYSTEPVETRTYKSPYMPLPYNEILKTKVLINNAGY